MRIVYGANTSFVKRPAQPEQSTQQAPEPPAPAVPEKTEEEIKQEALDHHIQALQENESVSEVKVENGEVLVKLPVEALAALHLDHPEESKHEDGESHCDENPEHQNHDQDHEGY